MVRTRTLHLIGNASFESSQKDLFLPESFVLISFPGLVLQSLHSSGSIDVSPVPSVVQLYRCLDTPNQFTRLSLAQWPRATHLFTLEWAGRFAFTIFSYKRATASVNPSFEISKICHRAISFRVILLWSFLLPRHSFFTALSVFSSSINLSGYENNGWRIQAVPL